MSLGSPPPDSSDLTRPVAAASFRDLWNLEHQVIIVFGAGGDGIGLATSRALAELGASLVLVDQVAELAEATAQEVGGVAVAADATQSDGVMSAIETAMDTFGRIDGGVDIIGRAARVTIDDMSPEVWDGQFDANLRHAYLIGHLLGPRLVRQGGGTLTFIASINADRGCHVTPAYAAAKAALVSWVRSLSNTYAPYGVRANAVSPAITVTPRMARVMGEQINGFASMTAIKEPNRPADVAAAVAFLTSPAARTITGIDLIVDGGTMARDPFYGDRLDATFADDLV
jgi:3-oxoacyl-[acyl-carrier protein] reductase